METQETKSNGQHNAAGASPGGPPAASAGPPAATAAAMRKKRGARRAYFILFGAAAAVLAAYYIHGYLTRDQVSTDDAQIDADVVPVASRVGGVVLHMKVKDNDVVTYDPSKPEDERGQIIAELDPQDFDAKLAQARAEEAAAHSMADAAHLQVKIVTSTSPGGVSQAKAQIAGSSAAVSAAAAQVAAAQAQVERAKAELAKAESDFARTKTLHDQGAMTAKELEASQSSRDSAKAALDAAQAGLAAARGMQSSASAQVAAAEGRLTQTTPVEEQIDAATKAAQLADARWDSAKAALQLATQQRAYTTIRAPRAGVVSKLAVHDGQIIAPGQTLLMLVPSESYVIANFKETQLDRIAPGQKVDVSVDALPGQTFAGVVDSVAPGTGARFSLMPPDNATGNFVKVVQRVPVKIRWAQPPSAALRAGLSAEVTIHLK